MHKTQWSLHAEELTNRNVLVNVTTLFMYSVWKQKIVHGRGPFNINLGIFVWSFDVSQPSLYHFPQKTMSGREDTSSRTLQPLTVIYTLEVSDCTRKISTILFYYNRPDQIQMQRVGIFTYDILFFKSQHTGTTWLEHALFCPRCSPSVTPTYHLDRFAEKINE